MTALAAPSQITEIAIAVLEHDGCYLIGPRPPGAPLAGLWEFAGGKIKADESPDAAAVRECREETGLLVRVTGAYPIVTHEYSHGTVRLHFLACAPLSPQQPPRMPFRWVPAAELGCYTFPPANSSMVRLLVDRARLADS